MVTAWYLRDMRLSKNFTLQEFTKSQTALRHGIDNTPGEEHLASAKSLFENVWVIKSLIILLIQACKLFCRFLS